MRSAGSEKDQFLRDLLLVLVFSHQLFDLTLDPIFRSADRAQSRGLLAAVRPTLRRAPGISFDQYGLGQNVEALHLEPEFVSFAVALPYTENPW